MHGSGVRRVEQRAPLLVLLGVLGCEGMPPQGAERTSPAPEVRATSFDRATAGAVRGRVTWAGAPPAPAPIALPGSPLASGILRQKQVRPNPHAPLVGGAEQGVASAVIFLRGVDRDRAKPWDHPGVRVEHRGGALHVRQGGVESCYGFVRRGAEVELISCEAEFHALHAAGSTFFTAAFPDPGPVLRRRFDSPGLVELSSAAGYCWIRAYLFVDDHPYYAWTDGDGRFVLEQVPPGRYEVVCWMPSWQIAGRERNPETGLVSRLVFQPPVEQAAIVEVGAKEATAVTFVFSADLFPAHPQPDGE